MYHRPVAAPERFSLLASLPPHGGFRRALALDRAGVPRAVVLAFAPSALTDDPARLAAVLRDVEAAARLHHPGAAPVLGTETVGGELAVVELHRPGATLRALLDAGGRLPPDVAVRILIDACAALAQAHAIDPGEGRRLAHGALDPARIVVGEDGAAFVCGLALAGGGEPADDLRALGSVLFECVAGEPLPEPPRRLEAHGIPAALAAAVDRATGAAGAPFDSAASLAAALAAALPPATHASVAAYVDAILPQDEGERAELRRTLETALPGAEADEVSEDIVVEPTRPVVPAPIAARPSARTAPPRTPDAAGTFPKPAAPARASRVPLAVALLCLAAGFGIGVSQSRASAVLARAWTTAISRWTAISTRTPTATPTPAATATGSPAHPERSGGEAPAESKGAGGAEPKGTSTPTAPQPSRSKRAPPPQKSVRAAPPALAGKGKLDVTAPGDAEVFLDGRLVGRGSVQLEIAEGAHRIEVRRAGAIAAERFSLLPGETWTYTVTPTP